MAGIILSEQDEAKIVMDYLPKKIHSVMGSQAHDFVSMQQETKSTFRMADLIAQQTGIDELEKASLEKRIEVKALERLKEIQESAYQEAYNLGLEEGAQKGFEEAKEHIQSRLSILNTLIEKLTRIKTDILQRNEIQIIDSVFVIANKLAGFEIEKNQERVLPILRQAMESLQKDESMTIKMHPDDISTIQTMKDKLGSEFEFLSTARLEPLDTLTPGGCVVETNYGLIDATLEERVAKLAEAMASAKPNAKRDEFS